MRKKQRRIIFISLLVIAFLGIKEFTRIIERDFTHQKVTSEPFDISTNDFQVPEFDGINPYVIVNDGIPLFHGTDYTTDEFETYSELDNLGRCQVAYANICREIMPVEPREGIGMIKPSGWHTVKYENIEHKYLYNRCHLIGYQLSGENANDKNLITGTRYMNVKGMLPFENQVANYVKTTGHHVLLRVTPIYEGDNLLASGVLFEAASVEDEEIRINVYIYNEQPGIIIDHETGKSKQSMK